MDWVYFATRYSMFKEWCNVVRGPYTNRDAVFDTIQVLLVIILVVLQLKD